MQRQANNASRLVRCNSVQMYLRLSDPKILYLHGRETTLPISMKLGIQDHPAWAVIVRWRKWGRQRCRGTLRCLATENKPPKIASTCQKLKLQLLSEKAEFMTIISSMACAQKVFLDF